MEAALEAEVSELRLTVASPTSGTLGTVGKAPWGPKARGRSLGSLSKGAKPQGNASSLVLEGLCFGAPSRLKGEHAKGSSESPLWARGLEDRLRAKFPPGIRRRGPSH